MFDITLSFKKIHMYRGSQHKRFGDFKRDCVTDFEPLFFWLKKLNLGPLLIISNGFAKYSRYTVMLKICLYT